MDTRHFFAYFAGFALFIGPLAGFFSSNLAWALVTAGLLLGFTIPLVEDAHEQRAKREVRQ